MIGFFDRFGFVLPGLLDLLQITLVAVAIYYVLRLLAATRALQMLVGLLLLVIVYFAARFLDLPLIQYILEKVFEYGAIAALIVFQPELRSALARLGQSRVLRFFNRLEGREVTDELIEAVERLSRTGTGAIIAVEKEVGLDEYATTGTRIQAKVGADLIVSLFSPYGPLHDGALLIQGDTIIAAGVILPLTQFPVTDRTLGTRHRAAIGLSEETDAVVVVVSEETSYISIARRGKLERNVSGERLRQIIGGPGTPDDPAPGAQPVPA
ncbi:MAG TPA: diadenylate cyclase CdaA [Longimicrobiales bacterium]|nr:diadenylate cyclase CdaA [Longimicrobiales bacterium]